MKVTLYPINRRLSALRIFLTPLFLFAFIICASSSASAKTVVIGSGSGNISQTSMSGLSSGDVLAIAPGTYSGATFSNLNGITIINNGGIVTFTGTVSLDVGLVNVTISGTGASGVTYGFQFGKPGSVFNGIALNLTSPHASGLRINYCEFWNVQNSVVDGSGNDVYDGTAGSLKLQNSTFDHFKMHSSGVLYQGSYGTANQFLVVADSITFSNMIIDTLYSNGTVINCNGLYRTDIHDWQVDATCLNPSGDVGMIVFFGNGNVHNIYKHGGRGYTARIWGCGLNGPGVTNIYNVIDLASNAYGGVDIRVDTTQLTASKGTPSIWGSDFHVYNMTVGNKIDVNGYVCPIVIIGTFLTYKMEVRNCLGFNNQYGANTIINNNSSGQTITDTSNNYYFTAGQVMSVLSDTVNCYIKTGSTVIDKGYTASLVKSDIAGIPRPQGAAYDVGAREYSSSTSFVTANAGSNQTITLPLDSVSLSGSASTVVNSTISSYTWSQTSGPSTATLTSSNTVSTKATGLIAGTYVFSLQVKDANNDVSTATVTITVNPANQPPVANAGSNQTITLPTSSVTLTGSATDATGTISSYAWTEVSGPNTVTIANATSTSTSVSGLIAGTYVFQLKATDNGGLSGTATVTVTVNAAVNQPPVVNAGSNQTITLPTSSVTLTGSATDATGTISSYAWTEVSGANTATISSAASTSTSISGLIAGTYVFQLKATDNGGLSGTATVTVTVNPAVNQPPVVSAGTAQTITLPVNTVTLTGTATDATGTISSYAWTEVSGPNTATIATASAIKTNITGLVAGTYVFQLKATDNGGLSGTGTVTVTVNPAPNQPPVANAGANQTITLPTNSISVDGSGSKDPDGVIASFSWTKVSGPAQGTITNATNVSTTITNLVQGTYVFKLTVTDNSGATASDTMTVVVNAAPNQPPVANAGSSKTITLPVSSTTLDGTQSSDPDGTIASYKWTQVSGPSTATISGGTTATPTVSSLVAGTYVFQLTVTDNKGATATAQVKVIVNPAVNQAPTANAGNNQTITLPTNSVSLDGSASKDPDGNIVSFNWTKISGPAQGTIVSATNVTTIVNSLVQGTYIFKLTVTDNNGATGTDSVTIIVNAAPNQPPVANAGASKTITLPVNSTSLDGSKSSDADGTISSYNWAQVSGPSTATITGATTSTPTVSSLIAGQYVFQLTVTDNSGASSTAEVNVTVNPAANLNPIANAGANQTITLPVDSVHVDGSASAAPSGTITNYAWAQVSGPAQGTIVNANNATTLIDNLVQGTYIFELTVTDNNGNVDKDSLTVTVKAAVNKAPIANAGSSKTIILPVDSVTLDGSKSSDPDGTVVSYSWAQTFGPSSATIASNNSATTLASGLKAGVYYFQLTVTDNSGATSKATVKVTVVPAANQPPIANAGASQAITLPVNSVTVDGSASIDPDGTISSYKWSEVSGPSQGTIVSSSSAITAINNLAQGVYVFKLTVTDNKGASASDSITITVAAALNQPPVANAGSSETITLPVDSVTLDGTKSSDADGTIASYNWVQVSGPSTSNIIGGTTASPLVSSLVVGQYTFQLTVTDNDGATSNAQVKVNVLAAANQLPIADAGVNQTITLPTSTANLDGSKSYDPDGTIASYTWTKASGTGAVTINNANTAKPTVTGLQAGQYVFKLTVADNKGATASAQVSVTVNTAAASNQAPVANAGTNQTITLPLDSVMLDGSKSSDADGTISYYSWSEASGSAGINISNPNTVTPEITGLQIGTYVFQLVVTDNKGATDTAVVTITVKAASQSNLLPIANAGKDTTIALPTNSVILNGSASTAPAGSITNYEWAQVSGPSTSDIASSGSVTTKVNTVVAGVYVFTLTVTDNLGATATDTVKVTVLDNTRTNATSSLTLYPNPTQSTINLQISSSATGTLMVFVYDMRGKVNMVKEYSKPSEYFSTPINLTTLRGGTYTIQAVIAKKTIMIAKFVKQ